MCPMTVRRTISCMTMILLTACVTVDTTDQTNGETSLIEPTISSISSATDEPDIIAENLNIPWDIAFLPDGDMLVTERPGTLVRIGDDRTSHPVTGVHHFGEGGLLGLTLHPDFERNGWLYLYMTTNEGGRVSNRIERYQYEEDALTQRTVILEGIPGAIYHDGGRIAFGPDGYLYVTTGDATVERNAQDTNSLAGKILRLNDDGTPATGNPFATAIYSYGHRNPQGITWDDQGRLWSTEHGRSGVLSGYDELNMIEAGWNYGWPDVQGDETGELMHPPVLHSGSNDTWAPASAAYLDGTIYFGGLQGEALYAADIGADDESPPLRKYFEGTYGRIRTVVVGPDGDLYLSTSNRDGRGSVSAGDDKIIRVDPSSLK